MIPAQEAEEARALFPGRVGAHAEPLQAETPARETIMAAQQEASAVLQGRQARQAQEQEEAILEATEAQALALEERQETLRYLMGMLLHGLSKEI